jgi:hypothetical protein
VAGDDGGRVERGQLVEGAIHSARLSAVVAPTNMWQWWSPWPWVM